MSTSSPSHSISTGSMSFPGGGEPHTSSVYVCTWKEVVQPEQHKTVLGSGCPACSKGEIYLEEPVARK